MGKPKVYYVHWKPEEARARLPVIRKAGAVVDYIEFKDFKSLRIFKEEPPDLVLIDLSRLPSHGRDVAVSLRQTRGTRDIPIVFVDGKPDKVEQTKRTIPDAIYTDWKKLKGSFRKALTRKSSAPVVPESVLAGYSGTPLLKKLGIKDGLRLIIAGGGEAITAHLGPLGNRLTIKRRLQGKGDLIFLFVTSAGELTTKLPKAISCMADGAGIWIAWPKKSSGVAGDLTQTEVRRTGLAAGLVDHKICAIDSTWSGLRFVRRKA
jgi:CheY-like chemotaxis protein